MTNDYFPLYETAEMVATLPGNVKPAILARPVSPITYSQNTKPVITETATAKIISATPVEPIPSITRLMETASPEMTLSKASLPLDQKAYKPEAVPVTQMNPTYKDATPLASVAALSGTSFSWVWVVVIIGVIFYFLKK